MHMPVLVSSLMSLARLLLGCYFLIDLRISLYSSRVCLKSIFFRVSFDI